MKNLLASVVVEGWLFVTTSAAVSINVVAFILRGLLCAVSYPVALVFALFRSSNA